MKPHITVRPATKQDIPWIQEWLQAGAYYNGEKITEEMLFGTGVESLIFSDENGPIISAQFYRVVRAHVQFKPNERRRTARALTQILPKLFSEMKRVGFTEMVFSSASNAVVAFFKRFGFKDRKDEQSLYL